jgi:CYTH domain-containing protein
LSQTSRKTVRKMRYQYLVRKTIAEIDIFQDHLKGLILIDFEFETIEEKKSFIVPDFCLCEVTQEQFVAGGSLAGRSYMDIEKYLQKVGYVKI